MSTLICIARDHSRSMTRITGAAKDDYNAVIRALRNAAADAGDVFVSTVKFGFARNDRRSVESEYENMHINAVPELGSYRAFGCDTPLIDATMHSIRTLERYGKDDDRFIVIVTTDGGENSSVHTVTMLKDEISRLTKTGNWTFVIRVPKGGTNSAVKLGFPQDNILEWETTTRGQQVASTVTTQALTTFVNSGEKSTTKFFANLANVNVAEVRAQMVDVSSKVSWVYVHPSDEGRQIREFVESKTGSPMLRGMAFYQLVKKEPKVQDHKRIAIRVKKTGEVFIGDAARQMLGLPQYGTVCLVPDNLGEFDIFIQSTSVNRKLNADTQVMLWVGAGTPYKK